MSDDWTDRLAGARMQVDQRFEDRVSNSRFSNQEWGLIMTAVEWRVEHAGDPERARLVADTDKIRDIIPELDNIQQEMGGSPRPVTESPSGEGIVGKLKQYLSGLQTDSSSGSDEERLAEASTLVEDYAGELQTFLEERDRWEDIRQAARE